MLSRLSETGSRVGWTWRAILIAGAVAMAALPLVDLGVARDVVAGENPFGQPPPDEAPAAGPPVPPTEFLPLPTEREAKILDALDSVTKMDFVDTPLSNVVSFLMDYHEIPIHLDEKSLAEVGVDLDTPVTLKVHDVRLASGLRLLLRNLDLAYLVADEVLLITTQDRAESELVTLTYPVGDLVSTSPGEETVAKGNAYEPLTEVIMLTVRPDSWNESGGHGAISAVPGAKSLVISQTRDVHDDVLRLLRSLRKARQASAP